jgi:hypothetical protein
MGQTAASTSGADLMVRRAAVCASSQQLGNLTPQPDQLLALLSRLLDEQSLDVA